ncbi:MAG: hypothetical protein ABL953_04335 [Ilumatobacteraceae bacterium]
MKQHPVRAAFEQVQDAPSREFRDTLRAQLLADLVAPIATPTPQTAQEIPLTDTPNNPKLTRGRTLLGIAAAVIVAVGVTAVVVSQDDNKNESVPATDPTTTDAAPTRSDSLIADAALLTEDDLGSSFRLVATSADLAGEKNLQADVPECAEVLAAHGDLLDIAPSTGRRFANDQGQALVQTVVIFPTLEDATRVFEAYAADDGKCAVGAYSTGFDVTAVAVDFAPPMQYGDQQTSFGVNTPLDPPQLSHFVWVQVGRAMVRIIAHNEAEGATEADPLGMLDIALAAAVESLAAELAAG